MSMLKHKTFDGLFKSLDDSGEFTFYAAIFGNLDRDGDVIEPGAFQNLDQFVRDGFVSFNHQWQALPVAFPTAASQDTKGLLITAKFHSIPEAQACRTVARERLAAGKAVPCSIGYRVIDSAMETRNGQRVNVLKSLSLFEAGMVNVPANPAAEVGSVKGFVSLDQARELVDRVKSGRVLSAANHDRLKSWAKDLHDHGQTACTMAKDVMSWLKAVNPDGDGNDDSGGPDAEPDVDPDDKSGRICRLKARAVRGRACAACP